MSRYFLEHSGCFQPRVTTYELESNTCAAWDAAVEAEILAPWVDVNGSGAWWLDVDGVTLVGWVEPDGVTYYPPLESYPQ